ncbi:MAG TPA: serine protease [Polyangiaceae bacterium]|nr:serine protease [Polyangiaceae bacterium]
MKHTQTPVSLTGWGRFQRLVVGLSVWLIALSLNHRARADDLTYSKLDEATVRVFSYKSIGVDNVRSAAGQGYALGAPDMGHGSGVLISKDGLILTARHVVEDTRLLAVLLPGRDRPLPAEVVYTDKDRDISFVAVVADTPQYLELPAQKPKLSVRETVYVVGYPLDASRTRPQSEQGIVSGVLPDGSLQLGIALNPGNSGGPVVDAKERFIGIAVARADPAAGAQGIGVAVPVEHILRAYSSTLKSAELSAARTRIRKRASRGQAEAEVLSAWLTADDSNTAWQALSGKAEASSSSASVDKWLKELAKDSQEPADLLALAAVQEWNAAAVLEARHQSTGARLEAARELVKRAAAADGKLAERSAFVAMVLEGKEPGSLQDNGQQSAGENAQSADADRERFLASVVTKKELPTVRVGPTIGGFAPFQVVGLGVTGKFMLGSKLNINARYSYGFHINTVESETKGSHFAEATVGYALGTWVTESNARLIVDVEHRIGVTVLHYVPAKIPAVHTLVLEGGAMTGLVNLLPAPDPSGFTITTTQQIVVPEAGLRYMYFFSADSPYMAGAQRGGVDLALHGLGPIFNVPNDARNADGKPISPNSIGFFAEVGWQGSGSWGHTEFGLGYLPHGDWLMLRLAWSYLFY